MPALLGLRRRTPPGAGDTKGPGDGAAGPLVTRLGGSRCGAFPAAIRRLAACGLLTAGRLAAGRLLSACGLPSAGRLAGCGLPAPGRLLATRGLLAGPSCRSFARRRLASRRLAGSCRSPFPRRRLASRRLAGSCRSRFLARGFTGRGWLAARSFLGSQLCTSDRSSRTSSESRARSPLTRTIAHIESS